jgi:hypothetical protein
MKNIAKAKCAANTQRNRSKSIARFAKGNKPRRENGNIMLGFVPGTTMSPVLDLLHLGGPDRKRVLRPVSGELTCLRHPMTAKQFHTSVAAALKAAGL